MGSLEQPVKLICMFSNCWRTGGNQITQSKPTHVTYEENLPLVLTTTPLWHSHYFTFLAFTLHRCSFLFLSVSSLHLSLPSLLLSLNFFPLSYLTGSADAHSYLHWSIGQETDQRPPPHLPLWDWVMTGARAWCHFIHQTMTATCLALWWDVTDL